MSLLQKPSGQSTASTASYALRWASPTLPPLAATARTRPPAASTSPPSPDLVLA